MPPPTSRRQGRPPATDHGRIEAAAFRLFEEQGFEATTVDEIAAAAGIGRRTLFRYFPSKNDIPWGQFDASLAQLREFLAATPEDMPVHEAVQRAIHDFNRLDPEVEPFHRRRMQLLLTTPVLQAHSTLRYADWRQCIAEFVAARYALSPHDLLPRTIGQVSLALSLSAYEQWLEEGEGRELPDLLNVAFAALESFMSPSPALG